MLAVFRRHPHHLAWWHVANGTDRECNTKIVIDRWDVGLKDVDGRFVPKLQYPEDYARNASSR